MTATLTALLLASSISRPAALQLTSKFALELLQRLRVEWDVRACVRMRACPCVCVCVRARARERERVCECVCMRAWVWVWVPLGGAWFVGIMR